MLDSAPNVSVVTAKRFYLAMAVALSLISGCSQTQLETNGDNLESAMTKREGAKVVAAERAWLNAVYRLDLGAVDASESEDFTLITPAMMLGKKMQMESIREGISNAGTTILPPEVVLTQQVIRVYGRTAVVTDLCTISGGGAKSVTSPGTYWQTEVWHRQGDEWKIAHMHISTLQHGM